MKKKTFRSYLEEEMDALNTQRQIDVMKKDKPLPNLILAELIKQERFFESMLDNQASLGDMDGDFEDQLPETILRGLADRAEVPFEEVICHKVEGKTITILTENDGYIQFINK